MRKQLGILSISMLPILGLVACKDEVTTEDVNQRTSAVVSNVARQSARAFLSLQSSETFAALGRGFEVLGEGFSAVPMFAAEEPMADDPMRAEPVDPSTPADPMYDDIYTEEEEEMSEEDIDRAVDEMSAWLEENIFTEANLESSDETSATYRLRGELFCSAQEDCAMAAPCDPNQVDCYDYDYEEFDCSSEPDEECIAQVNEAKIRLKVTFRGDDALTVALQLGPDRLEPVALDLAPEKVRLSTDLADVKEAIIFLSTIAGEEIPELPETMVGRVSIGLTVNGEQDISVELSILEAVAFAMATEDGPVAFDAGAADPMMQVRAEGLAERVTVTSSSGLLSLVMPWAMLDDGDDEYVDATDSMGAPAEPVAPAAEPLDGTFSFKTSGGGYSIVLEGGNEALKVRGVHMNAPLAGMDYPVELKRNDTLLFFLDLNAESGRSFDVDVTPDTAADSALFTFTPEFDLSVGFFLESIAANDASIDPWLFDDVYNVNLSGSGSASVLPVAADDAGFPGGLKVVAGTLVISASGSAQSVVVNEGECLSGTEVLATDAHPVLGHFIVVACP